ncbi:peptide/nickel transport system ATP-binding protein [Prauserella aidingensis]|uniref:ABC transporter ATP-binding protein n=1 Tax=Prauserella aidingensis TaxID=387890 RepID=UPI0020A5A3EF|nr:ATP-binding cassette domain-containing protein [Prauserella aidingensis]MCP2253657.1 peptide/nickel transport system ATP-binding protein [Prauserella aidingensis]
MLSATDLVVGYRRGRPVLDGVDIELHPGATVGLAGPSGCGKSTLAAVLALLLEPWSGSVTLDGRPVRRFRHRVSAAERTSIGVVFQQPRLAVDPRWTLDAVVRAPLVASKRRDDGIVAELTEAVGLTRELLGRRPHEVSDGQLQRACLARALVLRPRYLICDEMTSMVDASTTALLVHLVRSVAAAGTGVLAVSHDDALLDAWADDVVRWR